MPIDFVSDFSEMEPGAVGLALSYAVTLTGMFQWGVRQSAEVENMVRPFILNKGLKISSLKTSINNGFES